MATVSRPINHYRLRHNLICWQFERNLTYIPSYGTPHSHTDQSLQARGYENYTLGQLSHQNELTNKRFRYVHSHRQLSNQTKDNQSARSLCCRKQASLLIIPCTYAQVELNNYFCLSVCDIITNSTLTGVLLHQLSMSAFQRTRLKRPGMDVSYPVLLSKNIVKHQYATLWLSPVHVCTIYCTGYVSLVQFQSEYAHHIPLAWQHVMHTYITNHYTNHNNSVCHNSLQNTKVTNHHRRSPRSKRQLQSTLQRKLGQLGSLDDDIILCYAPHPMVFGPKLMCLANSPLTGQQQLRLAVPACKQTWLENAEQQQQDFHAGLHCPYTILKAILRSFAYDTPFNCMTRHHLTLFFTLKHRKVLSGD